MPSSVSSGPTRRGTNIGSASIRSESMNTMMSPVVAASERHSASPLPGCGGISGSASSRVMTRAPAARARAAVSSVDPESSTISSSTRPPSIGVMVPMTAAMVSASFSAGSTTEMVRPRLAAVSSATVQVGRCQLCPASQASPGPPEPALMPTPARSATVAGLRKSRRPSPARGGSARPRAPGTSGHHLQRPVRSQPGCPRAVGSVPRRASHR